MEIHASDRVSPAIAQIPFALTQALASRFRALGQRIERTIKGDLLSGNVLDVRSGQGRRSIFSLVTIEGSTVGGGSSDVVLTVGADLSIAPYMRLLALGGTIVPKRSQFLTIPMDAAQTASGVARFSARDVIGNPSAYGFSSTFTRLSGNGGMIFGVKYKRQTIEGGIIGGVEFKRQTILVEGGRVVPLFALKTSVTVPARNYLFAAQTFHGQDIRDAYDGAGADVVGGRA